MNPVVTDIVVMQQILDDYNAARRSLNERLGSEAQALVEKHKLNEGSFRKVRRLLNTYAAADLELAFEEADDDYDEDAEQGFLDIAEDILKNWVSQGTIITLEPLWIMAKPASDSPKPPIPQ